MLVSAKHLFENLPNLIATFVKFECYTDQLVWNNLQAKHVKARVLIANVKISSGEETIIKENADTKSGNGDIGILSIHHVGLLCENIERLHEFYQNILGLE
ncbi:hypothetical protein MKX01_012901 [Papaver californicum]|nr:hypothetical protein MKX01_012901 [Papaver californicum]